MKPKCASLGLLFVCTLSLAQASASGTLTFDAGWWNRAGIPEQQGFIYGYLDCRQLPNAAKASISDYENAVSATLMSRERAHPGSVTKAIERASKMLPSRDTRRGENYGGPHGFLDGDWWGSFKAGWPSDLAAADSGYVEGYLECAASPVTVQDVRWYQTAINRHYASGRHDHDKVADVLRSLLRRRTGH